MLDSIQDLYENAEMMSPGTTFDYRGYTLKKVDGGFGNSDHTEYMVLNREGRQVESYTIAAFDSFGAFQSRLDDLVDEDPDDLEDHLNN